MNGSPFGNAVLHVMSGTGNTFRMARLMEQLARPYVKDVEIRMIDDADPANEPALTRDTLVGVLFPAHGFMPPWSMIKHLLRMRRQEAVPALCVVSYLLHRLNEVPFAIPGPGDYFPHIIMYWIDFFVALFLSYQLFWLLMRIPAVNTLFTYTTLTPYYRRYHQPETSLKDLTAGR